MEITVSVRRSDGVMMLGLALSIGRVKRGRASFAVRQPRCSTTPA